MCIVGWLFSIVYCTDAGLSFLDVVDFYVNFIMLFVGFLETFAAGWIYGMPEQVEKYGATAVYTYLLANFGSVIIACIFWFFIPLDTWTGFLALVLVYGILLASTVNSLNKHMAEKEKGEAFSFCDLAFGNIMQLRDELSKSVGYLPKVWAFMIKQVIPHIILFLFFNLATSKTDAGNPQFSGYGSYSQWPYQSLGYVVTLLAAFVFVLGLIAPHVYKNFDKGLPDDGKEKEEEGGIEMGA